MSPPSLRTRLPSLSASAHQWILCSVSVVVWLWPFCVPSEWTDEDEDDGDEDEKDHSERVELASLLTPSSSSSLSSSTFLSPSSSSSSALTSAYFSSSLYGTVNADSVPLFERLVFRVSRGNAILHLHPIDQPLRDPTTHQSVSKAAFVLIHVGEEMEKRLRKCHRCSGRHRVRPPRWSEGATPLGCGAEGEERGRPAGAGEDGGGNPRAVGRLGVG